MTASLARIEVRCPAALKQQVALLAKERGVSQSEIGLAALEEFFNKPPDPDTVVRDALHRLEALLTTFIKVYFTTAPELTEPAAKIAAAQRSQRRFQQFAAVAARELEDGV